jgi:hypothetical protein
MQSKQKTRTQPRKQKKAKTAGKKAAPRSRAEGKRQQFGGKNSTNALSVGLAPGIRQRPMQWRFGAAAPHDEFPEGGLRISGVLPGSGVTNKLNGDYSTGNTGLWNVDGRVWACVHPGGLTLSGVVGLAVNLFSGTSPIAVIQQYFRKFRFRKLAMEYNGTLNAASAETRTLQISYERDGEMLDSKYLTATQDELVNSTSTRFSSWASDVMCPLIDQKRTDSADELFYTCRANDTITSSSAAFNRQVAQGLVSSAANAVPTAAETVYGTCLWHFVVDLYGFTNLQSTDFAFALQPKVKRDKGDEKFSDFVELTPKSRRVSETPPPSVRVSSKKN